MKRLISKFIKNESGATAIEYGLVASLIAIAIIVGARNLGTQMNNKFNVTANTMKNA